MLRREECLRVLYQRFDGKRRGMVKSAPWCCDDMEFWGRFAGRKTGEGAATRDKKKVLGVCRTQIGRSAVAKPFVLRYKVRFFMKCRVVMRYPRGVSEPFFFHGW